MQNKIFLLVPLVALIHSVAADAQIISMQYDGKEVAVSYDTAAWYSMLTGKYCEGKTYLHWNVVNQHSDGIYIVYSSTDGKKYDAIGHKKGTGVPISKPIAYYFQDENPSEGTTWYKVVHISAEMTYLVTDNVKITRHSVLLSETSTMMQETQ